MKCLAGCRGLKPEALEVFFRCIAKKLRLGIENPSKGYIQRSRITSVCFRMYTEDEARKMGVVGWVKNTRQGTVTGQVQGPEDKVNAMIYSLFWPLELWTSLAWGKEEGLAE
ncbi:acylphosphatase-2 isoform X9 [Chrysemys picta bellii]|uniref:acylphosphatase-2 isoform X9 n=1 Tax=Chrysemys picta bellii TaxID=8478 RepID=UPI000CE6345B|nr:acylphosphatase-2 isoform X9 [Chrysemys picta bellii]